ncbi:MAG: GlcG/HbpS family heme-binding protein [Planctomycetaceae bacterium]
MSTLINRSSLLASLSFVAALSWSFPSIAQQPAVRTDRAELTLAGAQAALAASLAKAQSMDVLVNIAVVDDGGHLLAFARMDGARPSSVYTSITKATTAATQRAATGPLRPDDPSSTHLNLAIEQAAAASGGKFTTLKGGVPIVVGDQVIGAVGVGGATGEQDAEVATAGVAEVAKAISAMKPASPDRPRG